MQTLLNKDQVIYAGFYSRLAAFITDNILLAIVLLIVKVPLWIVEASASDLFLFKPFIYKFTVVDVFYYLLTLTYFVLMTYYSGATVGKHLLKLKVVSSDGEKLTFMSVLIRESVGKYLSTFIVYIGYIMAAFDSRKQGLHDKIADTYVVYKYGFSKASEEKPMQQPQPMQQTQPMQQPRPMQQAQPMQPARPIQQAQPMQQPRPMQPVQPMQAMQPMQQAQPESAIQQGQPEQNGRFSQSMPPVQERKDL